MTAIDKDVLRDELFHAIRKVMNKQRDKGGLSLLTTESTELMMANAAMLVIEVTQDAENEWTDNGYLTA